ncbi:hypothetical protein TD95_004990 [Thielaviopsis punctulata]|uniref:Kinase n=1 Tax=Thielaviopsis punctulata TaxID=72032 RepID=A0A0F4ZCD0_9PEZI|nr:hypothetical protein TD95_004990 [Thielaviopsis punctulata]
MPSSRTCIPRHEELVAYNAVAGHDGTMCDPTGKLFVKPCTAAEIAFYESSQNPQYQDFRELMPSFYGTLKLNNHAQDAVLQLVNGVSEPALLHEAPADDLAKTENNVNSVSTSTTVSTTNSVAESTETTETDIPSCITITVDSEHVKNTDFHFQVLSQNQLSAPPSAPASTVSTPKTEEWVPNGGKRIKTDTAVVLENTTYGFKHPNILDCKLGTRLWADDAPQQKKDRFDEIARNTTHRNYGFRIAGMRAWRGSDNSAELDQNDYMVYDRLYGRDHVTDDTLAPTIRRFIFNKEAGITHELGQAVSAAFVAELEQVHEVLQRHNLRMYSGSLLFIFEGHGPTLAKKIEERARYIEELEAHPEESDAEDAVRMDETALFKAVANHGCTEILESGDKVTIINQDATTLDATSDNDDDDDDDDDDEDGMPKTHSLRLIDFAHAKWVRSEDGPDRGMLLGVKSLIDIFQSFVDEKEDPQEKEKAVSVPSLKQKAHCHFEAEKDNDQPEQHKDKKRKLSCV